MTYMLSPVFDLAWRYPTGREDAKPAPSFLGLRYPEHARRPIL